MTEPQTREPDWYWCKWHQGMTEMPMWFSGKHWPCAMGAQPEPTEIGPPCVSLRLVWRKNSLGHSGFIGGFEVCEVWPVSHGYWKWTVSCSDPITLVETEAEAHAAAEAAVWQRLRG